MNAKEDELRSELELNESPITWSLHETKATESKQINKQNTQPSILHEFD